MLMHRRRVASSMILDLTPILSLIVHLLPMLLIMVRFQQLAQIEVTGPVVPTLPAPSEAAYEAQGQRVVSVAIGERGFVVGGLGDADPVVPCKGACAPDTYDLEGLAAALRSARALHPDERRVVVAPAATVPYEVVVDVMDTARSMVVDGKEVPLFPTAILAAPAPAPEGP